MLVTEDLWTEALIKLRCLEYCASFMKVLKYVSFARLVSVSHHLEESPDIFSPSIPKASLNLLLHLAAKAELTVAGGPLLPDALLAALPPLTWRVIMSG